MRVRLNSGKLRNQKAIQALSGVFSGNHEFDFVSECIHRSGFPKYAVAILWRGSETIAPQRRLPVRNFRTRAFPAAREKRQ